MQAMAVFLLEIAQGQRNSSRERDGIPVYIKKLTKWLRCLREDQAVAERAYKVAIGVMKSIRKQTQSEIDDVLAEEEEADRADCDRVMRQQQEQATFSLDNLFDDPNAGVTITTPDMNYMSDPMSFNSTLVDPALYTEVLPMSYPEVSMADTYGMPFLSSFDQMNPFLDEEAWGAYPPSQGPSSSG
jgi:hypothetical protein